MDVGKWQFNKDIRITVISAISSENLGRNNLEPKQNSKPPLVGKTVKVENPRGGSGSRFTLKLRGRKAE